MKIAVIGTGSVGGTLGRRWVAREIEAGRLDIADLREA